MKIKIKIKINDMLLNFIFIILYYITNLLKNIILINIFILLENVFINKII